MPEGSRSNARRFPKQCLKVPEPPGGVSKMKEVRFAQKSYKSIQNLSKIFLNKYLFDLYRFERFLRRAKRVELDYSPKGRLNFYFDTPSLSHVWDEVKRRVASPQSTRRLGSIDASIRLSPRVDQPQPTCRLDATHVLIRYDEKKKRLFFALPLFFS